MYNFLNLGFEGYRRIALKDLRNARLLSRALESTELFTVGTSDMNLACLMLTFNSAKVLSNIHRKQEVPDLERVEDEDDPEHYQRGLPVVSFR
jgi:glutamate decarboxylase